jgi:hypothetical protein
VSFTTNDNDGLRELQKTTVSANVYAVNEIHIGSGSGEIHTDISIPVSINNMEPFSGFQFDLTLPQDISFVENSVALSTRKSDHSVIGSLINANTIRVIAYSNANAEFTGSDGEVMTLKLKPEVSSGNYNLTISNPIISNITLGDIESDSYNGSVQINAPNLVTNPSSISFGRVPITETIQQVIRLTNNGSAELNISSIVKDVSLFDIDTATPFNISQGEYKDITLTFTPSSNGNVDQDISIRHNGSTEQNIINVTADVFSPNYLKIKDVSVDVGGTSILEIELHNNDEVRGIQFDVTLNSEFNYDVSNYELIDNGTIFSSSTSNLGNNKHRFILYNTSGNTVQKGSGSILKIPFTVLENTSWGDYTVDFSNVVISGPNNTSVGSEALNSGKITVTDVTPPSITGDSSINVSEGSNSVIEIFTANESVTWSLAQSNDYSSFNVDPNTGELSFNSTPDYESPSDDNADNIYSLKILATDAYNNVGTLDVQITVINVNEPPNGSLTVNTTEVGEDWAIISWSYTEGSNPITGFRLWVRKGRGGSWNSVTVLNQFLDPEVRSYRLEGLDSGQLYAFRLWPTNSEGKDTSAGEPGFTTVAPDTTVPVITLLGDATVTIEVGSGYSDDGATASDNYDGDITDDIVVVNPVDTDVVGSYTITYNVSDAAGNAATEVTRTVNVVDTTLPVITLLGDATVTIEVGSGYTDDGATASDNYDGDITDDIVVVNPVDTDVVGSYTITYNVSDAAGNAATEVTRTVNVVDTTLPVITLLGDATVTIEVGSGYSDDGATASDNYDGDITDDIVVVNPVDTDVVGSYTITYNVSDAAGNAATEVTRTVNVVDTTLPVITLLGDATVTIEVGSGYTDDGATASDNYDGDITDDIVVVNPVDTDVVGSYTITYNVSDAAGNAATEVTRTVNVVDTTLPVITLLGDATVTIEVGSGYTDDGATASDNYDGDITDDIVVVNPVDTDVVGSYTITYNVSDAAGNAATEVTRTVNVVDTTLPVITLLGDATVTIEVGSGYTDDGATASDNYDGDITDDIVVVNPVDTDVVGSYTITYNVSDAAGNAATEVTREVIVENSLGIEDAITPVKLYPNPFSEKVIISSEILVDVSVYNILGSEVLKEKSVSSLNTSALKQGVYIFKIEHQGLETFVKMVK